MERNAIFFFPPVPQLCVCKPTFGGVKAIKQEIKLIPQIKLLWDWTRGCVHRLLSLFE